MLACGAAEDLRQVTAATLASGAHLARATIELRLEQGACVRDHINCTLLTYILMTGYLDEIELVKRYIVGVRSARSYNQRARDYHPNLTGNSSRRTRAYMW